MKWLPTTLILFSVGIIGVIAETAAANPWDSFVSDQQIFEAQTIRCDFTTGVSANWDGAEPKLELQRDGFGSEFLFDSIGEKGARFILNLLPEPWGVCLEMREVLSTFELGDVDRN